jgi:uncharacterized membrane protein
MREHQRDPSDTGTPRRQGDDPERRHANQDGKSLDEMEHMGAKMMRQRRQRELWSTFAVMILGLWLVSSPATFGYTDTAMRISDIASGMLLVVTGLLSIDLRRSWAPWATCVVGIWLLFAPLILWAADPAAFANDTFVGSFAIACSILIPGMPGMRMLPGPTVPPGWSYNPSDWVQRAPVIALGIVSFFISRYLAAYQLGYIDHAWDPIFGHSTVTVLDSDVSRAWPVPDAGFGAVSYLLEALSGFMGAATRWRTMPWMVLMFGVLVIPLGVVSIALVVMQPVMVGHWCALCLVTALFMLIMIPLALDEIVAMGQFMAGVRRKGQPFWTNFWLGGSPDSAHDQEEVQRVTFHDPLGAIARVGVLGVTIPWNLLLATVLGFWLMAAPAVFDATSFAADSDHLVGPLVAVIAVIAMAEPVRLLRYGNVLTGLWLLVTPWFLAGATTASVINSLLVGVILIALSIPRGQVMQRYGGWVRWTR